MKQKLLIVSIFSFLVSQLISGLILSLPNPTYLNSLNIKPYLFVSSLCNLFILIVLILINRFKSRKSSRKKIITLYFIFTFLIYLATIMLFYRNLPNVTYLDATKIVANYNEEYNQIFIPESREEKLIYQKRPGYLTTFSYNYIIYINDGNNIIHLIFDPYTSKFTELNND